MKPENLHLGPDLSGHHRANAAHTQVVFWTGTELRGTGRSLGSAPAHSESVSWEWFKPFPESHHHPGLVKPWPSSMHPFCSSFPQNNMEKLTRAQGTSSFYSFLDRLSSSSCWLRAWFTWTIQMNRPDILFWYERKDSKNMNSSPNTAT